MIPFPFYWEEDDGQAPISDLFVPDIHLATRVWNDVPMEGDAQFGFDQVVDLALERRVQRVHFLGDVIDKAKNNSAPVAMLSRGMEELETAQLLVPFLREHGR